MFDRRLPLSADACAANLYQAAELIGKAARLLDDTVDKACRKDSNRIEAIEGQSAIDFGLSQRLETLAAQIMQEHEAACAQDDLEMALMDAAAHAARVIEAAERV